MIYLSGFAPFQPTPGLALWSLVIFVLFWLIMGKYAFKPIANALKKRESDIKDSLEQAALAREEMAKLNAENEQILAEAREERGKILKEAIDAKNTIVNEAKAKAKEEASRIVTSAKLEIENERKAAMISVKNEVGTLATDIAEKIIRKQLAGDNDHESFVGNLIDEIKFN